MEDGVIQLRFRKLEQNGKIILHSVMSLGLIDALAGVPLSAPTSPTKKRLRWASTRRPF